MGLRVTSRASGAVAVLLTTAISASTLPAAIPDDALSQALQIVASDMDAGHAACLGLNPLPAMLPAFKASGALAELFAAPNLFLTEKSFKAWSVGRTRSALQRAQRLNHFYKANSAAESCAITLEVESPRASQDALALRVIAATRGGASRERAYLFRYEKGKLIVASRTAEHIIVS